VIAAPMPRVVVHVPGLIEAPAETERRERLVVFGVAIEALRLRGVGGLEAAGRTVELALAGLGVETRGGSR
jgi:hypothetical protein